MRRFACAAFLAMPLAGLAVTDQSTAPQTRPGDMPSLIIDSFYGADLFRFYCAPCHGHGGRGDGPVAAALKNRPADLTTITRRNGGAFPRARIIDLVTNGPQPGPIEAHGPGDMPVWGPTFRSLGASDLRVKTRIANLIDYVETLQQR